MKGDVLSRSGNCSGAIQAYQRSIAINPDYDLAWPGMTNATVELNQAEQRCAAAAAQTAPATTQAGVPALIVVSAMGIVGIWAGRSGR